MKNSKFRYCPFEGLMMTTVTLLTAVTLMFSASTLLVSCSGGDTPQKVVDPTPTPTPTPTPDPNQPNNPNNPTNPDQPTQPDQPTVPTLPENVEIGIKATMGQFRAATRGSTRYDASDLDDMKSGFHCSAFLDSPSMTYINNIVKYDEGESRWRFHDGSSYCVYFWPPSDNLNFLAYYPDDELSYIPAGISYNNGNPTFNCVSLPATPSGQAELKEFLYAYTPDQNMTNAASGVELAFHHPFAQITFKNGKAGSVKITNVTFKNIKNNGTFTYNSPQWATSGDDVDFEADYAGDAGYSENLGGPYLVVPQTKDPLTISVTYTSKDWGGPAEKDPKTSTATISINWQPGYSYFYTFNIVDGDLVVNTEIFTEQW